MKQTETLNEKMDIIARAGLELSEEELEAIAGGNQKSDKKATSKRKCHECEKATHMNKADYNSKLYEYKTEAYCKEGHHYRGGVYTDWNKSAAAKWLREHGVK